MLSLFAAAPAEAQNPVWEAMLTPQEIGGVLGIGCTNSGAGALRCSNASTLSDDDFSVGANNYTIEAIQLFSNGGLSVTFSAGAAPTPLSTLRFCSGSTGHLMTGVTANTWTTSNSGFTWTAGTAVSLSIASSCATQSTVATLSSLSATSSTSASGSFTTLNIGTFASGTTTYTASVANSVTHVKLTPATTDSDATVKVGKGTSLTAVSSGTASGAIPLSVGSNALKVEVTAEDGTTMQTYTVTVTRAAAQQTTTPSGNAVWSATLTTDQSTQHSILSGSAEIYGCANGVAHTPACSDTTKLTDDDFTHGGTTYTITEMAFHRRDAGDNEFFLRLSGRTGAQTKTALTGLALNVGSTNPATTYPIADATASGNVLLWTSSLGWTPANKPSTVSVSLTPSTSPTTDATLSGLTASTGTSAAGAFSALTLDPSTFSASVTAYTATVPGTTTHLKITPTANNAGATVKVGKGSSLATVSSGSPSAAIPLSLGANAVTVEVTAADGTTKQTYTVTVTRTNVPAAPANLKVKARSQQLNLSWTAPSGTLTGYDVHYTSADAATVADSAAASGSDASAAWVAVDRGTENTPPAASQNIAGLANGTAYRVRVRATNAVGDGVWAFGSGTPSLPAITLSASPNPVPEGRAVTVTATASQPLASAATIPVTISTAAPNTAEPGDVGALASITIAAGAVSGAGEIATNNDADENDETFTVSLGTLPSGVVAGSPSSVRISIADDEGRPKVRLSAAPNPVAEGSRVTLTVTLSEALAQRLSVPLTLRRDTAERNDTGTRNFISIGAGETSATGTISTRHDADADDETFTVSIRRLPTTDAVVGSPSSVQITIEDDETAVSLSASPNPVAEGQAVTVTATLAAALSSDVTVPLMQRRVTAEAGDHSALSSIAIAAGQTSGTGTITANQDADNDDETFTVEFGALPSGLGLADGDSGSVRIVIDDDETPSVSLSADESVLEGDAGTVTARLSSVLPGAVTIPLTVTAGTAESGDYSLPSPVSVAIPAGQSRGTLTIRTNQDADEADETLTATLGALPSEVTAGSPSSAVVTIVDDEGRPSVSLSAPGQVREGSRLAVTATLTEALTVDVTIPLRYGIAGEDRPEDTAEAGDYETPAGIRIAAGATTGRAGIRANQDDDGHGERFTVSLDTADLPPHVRAGSPASVEIDIVDDETSTVTLRAIDTGVAEGDEAEFIMLFSQPVPASSGGLGADILVRVTGITTEHDPDEYEDVKDGTILVRVPAGETSAEFAVQTYRDADTDDERFRVDLRAADQYGWLTWLTIGSPSSAEITIEDDAATDPTGEPGSGTGPKGVFVSLSAESDTVEEGRSLEVTVSLSAPAPADSWEEITIPVNVTGIDTEPGDVHEGAHPRRIGGGRTSSTWYLGTSIDKDTDDEKFTVAIDTDNLPEGISAGSPTSLEITVEDVLAGLPGRAGGHGGAAAASRGAAGFAVAENHAAGAAVGWLGGLLDGAEGRALSLSSRGADHRAFAIDANGALHIAEGVALDYERQAEYTFVAAAGGGGRDDRDAPPAANRAVEVTVTVENVEEPPGAPAGVTAAATAPDRIELDWTAPSDIGARLDGYEVQYRRAEDRQGGAWTDHPHRGTSAGAAIDGLAARSAYEMRVRSLGDGESEWATAAARTTVAAPVLAGALPDLELVAGGRDIAVDASAALAGEDLAFAFASSDASVASFDGAAEAANQGAAARLRGEAVGAARITVTATNPGGAASVTFAVTVKAVSDEEAEALGLALDGLSRSLLSGAAGVVGARLAASDAEARALPALKDIDALATLSALLGLPAPAGGPAAPGGPLAGPVGPWAPPDSSPAAAAWSGAGFDAGRGMEPPGGPLSGDAMPPGNGPDALGAPPRGSASLGGPAVGGNLWNRSFAFSVAPSAGQERDGRAPSPLSGLTVWGMGDVQNFSGGGGGSRFDGEWRTAYLGADRRFGERWLGGLALSRGRGQANYTFAGDAPGAGRLATDLAAVYPYARGALPGGTELWAMLGAGSGAATLERDGAEGDVPRGDLGMRLGAAGLRHALAKFEAVRISVLADVGAATLDVDGDAALAELDSSARRARAGVEVAGTGRFSPYVRINARYDGGGDMAEAGYEGEAGLRYAGTRIELELRGRSMALAGGADYRESGAAATLTVKAAPDGTGLFASLAPSWGRPGASNFVWGRGAMPAMGPAQPFAAADPGMTLNAELGYDIESRRLRGLLTPTLGFQRTGPAGDALRFGAAYAAKPEWLRRALSIGLGLRRQETLEGPAWGAELRTEMRW